MTSFHTELSDTSLQEIIPHLSLIRWEKEWPQPCLQLPQNAWTKMNGFAEMAVATAKHNLVPPHPVPVARVCQATWLTSGTETHISDSSHWRAGEDSYSSKLSPVHLWTTCTHSTPCTFVSLVKKVMWLFTDYIKASHFFHNNPTTDFAIWMMNRRWVTHLSQGGNRNAHKCKLREAMCYSVAKWDILPMPVFPERVILTRRILHLLIGNCVIINNCSPATRYIKVNANSLYTLEPNFLWCI